MSCLGISLSGGVTHAQYLPDAERPVLSGAVGNGYLQVSVQGGRIVFSSTRVISPRMVNGPERLTMRLDGDFTAVQYQCKSEDEEFVFEAGNQHRFSLRRVFKAEEEEVEFRQTPEAPLELRVVLKGQTQHYRSPGLWHLLIAQKEVSQQLLVPLLERLRPGWSLSERALQVEEELLRTISPEYQQDQRRWAELVRQLADDRYARREAADRELRSAGHGLVAYLERLDFRRLEPEQQSRIRSILVALGSDAEDDSPEQAAAALTHDPATWLVFLARPEVATRRAAAEHLASLLRRPMEFDPTAEASIRQQQIQKLREWLENR